MIRSYRNEGTRDIAYGVGSKKARRTLPEQLHAKALERLNWLNSISSEVDLMQAPHSFRPEKLSGDRRGQISIRINDQYRVCFCKDGLDLFDVEICDYH